MFAYVQIICGFCFGQLIIPPIIDVQELGGGGGEEL